MKLTLIDMFKSASGKVCQDSEFYTSTRNGKVFTGRICHPSGQEPTAEQAAFRNKFKTVISQVNLILKEGPGGDKYDDYIKLYKANPGKYDTFRGYLFAVIWKKN